jgi:Tol biopolymer transport system component
LSPNKHFLALFETLFQCPEDSCHVPDNSIQSAIKILDIETNAIVATFITSDYISRPSWSPDSKYVVFDLSPSNRYTVEQTSQIILLNVQNSEYTKLGLGSEPSFAKNENRIVSYKLTDKHLTSCCQVINLPEKAIKDVVATQPDTFSIALSPNGKTIAGLTRKEQDNYPFLVDLDTSYNQILDAPLKENNLINNIIKWSPDGRLLSISTIDPPMVTVLDLSGNIQLSLENVYTWEWSNSGEQILYVQRYNNGCRQVEPYFYTITLANKNVSRIDLPPSIKDYLSQKVFDMVCSIGIGSVTW